MVGEACLPSNSYYPRTPDYTLYSGVHVCWSEHSDSSFVYKFMSLDYGLGTITTTTFKVTRISFIIRNINLACTMVKICVLLLWSNEVIAKPYVDQIITHSWSCIRIWDRVNTYKISFSPSLPWKAVLWTVPGQYFGCIFFSCVRPVYGKVSFCDIFLDIYLYIFFFFFFM